MSMFSIVTAAANRKLTTLENLKTDLGITGSTEDAKLERLIDRVSSMVARYVGVPTASDGSATLALETLAETFWKSPWLGGCRKTLILARRPVVEVVSVAVGDTVVDPSGYEIDGAAGILRRIGSSWGSPFSSQDCRSTVVTYKAGWTVPGVAYFTLPPDIEGAVVGLIRSARFSADRDPAVKSEWTTDIERIDYWVGQIGQNGAFPPDIAAVLDPFCYEPEI